MAKLSEKQKRFCEEYVIDLNATQAAIRAGYSQKTARQIATQNLSKLYIQDYIQELRLKQQERTEITADMVVRELAAIGFACLEDVVEVNNNYTAILPEENRPARAKKSLKKVKFKRYFQGNGEDAEEVEVVEIEMHDKLSALDKLGRHLGIYEKDNSQSKLSAGVMLVPMLGGVDDWESVARQQQEKLQAED